MPKAILIVRKPAVRPEQVADTLVLDHAGRRVEHGRLSATGGLAFDLALGRAAVLEDGDALKLDDGRLVAVRAAEEPLLEVRAGNPGRLMRLAWQLGGHHVPAEISADVLYVPASAAELVRGGGCEATAVTRPFRPEKEAHDHSQCGHDHHHGHQHDHGHEHHHEHHGHAHGHGHHAHEH